MEHWAKMRKMNHFELIPFHALQYFGKFASALENVIRFPRKHQ